MRQEDMHAIFPLHVACAESLDSERSEVTQATCTMQLNFFAHFTVHTWQTSVCKEGGDKALRMDFEGKPGEDSLRPKCTVQLQPHLFVNGVQKICITKSLLPVSLITQKQKKQAVGIWKNVEFDSRSKR